MDMAIKRLFFVLSILLCMFGTKALAYDFSVKNSDGKYIYYQYINYESELAVTNNGENSYSGSVVIPEEVTYMDKTLKVTSIGLRAFNKCDDLTSVTIPNSVRNISVKAFYGCSSLTSVSIPNSVTSIDANAFENCSGLTSIAFSYNMTSIGDYAFLGCSSLTSVTIPNSVTSIGRGAFASCI